MLLTFLSAVFFLAGLQNPVKAMVVDSGQADNQAVEVQKTLDQFYSAKASNRDNAQTKLIVMAKTSSEARSQIIPSLINAINEQRDFEIVRGAIQILGSVKAVEAVPALTQHISANNGTVGLPLSHFPAVRALIQIGEPAVSELARTLRESEAPHARELAAEALGEIGGDQAKEALTRALTTEKDQGVIKYIQMSLSILSQKRKSSLRN